MGSGVAGALAACKLADAGHQVIVVEAGPSVKRSVAAQAYEDTLDFDNTYPQGSDQPNWSNPNRFYQQSGPVPFGAVYEKLVGGTTWHWLGTCLRLHPHDFQMRSRYGLAVDWPLSYNDLEPFYAEAERELGVCGGTSAGSPRSGDFPMPALKPTYLDAKVGAAARSLGHAVEVMPAARNSIPYRGRPACQSRSTCTPICPVGAKYDASVHVERARAAGVQILENTTVTRILHEGGRVTAVVTEAGKLEADVFVLAANAIETPRLLLHSGLGNAATGRYLMGMAGQISQALAPSPIWPFQSPQVVSGLTEFRDGTFRKQRAGFVVSIGNDGWPVPAGKSPAQNIAPRFIAEGLIGDALTAAIRDHVSRQVLLVSNCEELPLAENRVALDALPDSRGVPLPRIHYKIGRYTEDAIEETVLVHQRLFEAMKATEIHHLEDSLDPAHAAGTCRMGLDPATSVVDRDLRSHLCSNLYILGSTVFPTSGCAPPTLTVASLALRCAEHIKTGTTL